MAIQENMIRDDDIRALVMTKRRRRDVADVHVPRREMTLLARKARRECCAVKPQ